MFYLIVYVYYYARVIMPNLMNYVPYIVHTVYALLE